MRVIGSIAPIKLMASDFTNSNYIGLKLKKHHRFGRIVIMESRSHYPKRYCVMIENRYTLYFLSYLDAMKYFTKITEA